MQSPLDGRPRLPAGLGLLLGGGGRRRGGGGRGRRRRRRRRGRSPASSVPSRGRVVKVRPQHEPVQAVLDALRLAGGGDVHEGDGGGGGLAAPAGGGPVGGGGAEAAIAAAAAALVQELDALDAAEPEVEKSNGEQLVFIPRKHE